MMLKELGEIITGNTPSKQIEEFWNAEDICFIKPDVIADSGVNEISESNEYISEEARKKARVVSKDAIFVTCIGSIGKIGIAKDGEYAFNQQINAIIPNEKVHPKYLAYNLLFNKERLIGMANAPVVPIINKSQFGEFTLNIEIDSDKQSEIVKVLDKLMDIIKHRENELFALDALIKARFVELFGTVENNVFNFDVKTIGEVATLKSGTSLPSEIENEGGNVPYIKVGDMNYSGNEYYITTSSRYVTEKTAGKGIFEIGTVIFPKRGGAIGTNKKRLTTLPICADLNVMGVTPNKSHILPSYLMAYFDLVDLGSLDNGSSVPQINNKDIAPLRICIPPINLQNEFAKFVEQVDKSKVAIQKIHKKGYNCL